MSDLTPGFVTIPRIVYDALLRVCDRHSAVTVVVLEVLADHHLKTFDPTLGDWCSCGYHSATLHAWHQHIADQITDQLQENHQ